MDKKYVETGESKLFPIAGEGLFAKIDIPKDTTFVLYNGQLYNKADGEQMKFNQNKTLAKNGIADPHHPEAIAAWKYRHNVKMCEVLIDIPAEFEPTEKYAATFGHKLNHMFEPTTRFVTVDSPRFGIIVAVRTKVDVKAGDELTVAYGYPANTDLPWYQHELEKYKKEHPEKFAKDNEEKKQEEAFSMGNLIPDDKDEEK